jgi:lysyl-tRNA synthetase class II
MSKGDIYSYQDFQQELLDSNVLSPQEGISAETKSELRKIFDRATEVSKKSGTELSILISEVINIYKDELRNPDLTWEQRKEIYERIEKQIAQKSEDVDKDRKFLLALAYGLGVALVGGAVSLAPKVIDSVFNARKG